MRRVIQITNSEVTATLNRLLERLGNVDPLLRAIGEGVMVSFQTGALGALVWDSRPSTD